MNLYKSNNDYYLIAEHLDKSDEYFMYKMYNKAHSGILKLKKLSLATLEKDDCYVYEGLQNLIKAIKEDITVGKTHCFLSEAKDDASLLFVMDEYELGEFVKKHESIYSMQVATNNIVII